MQIFIVTVPAYLHAIQQLQIIRTDAEIWQLCCVVVGEALPGQVHGNNGGAAIEQSDVCRQCIDNRLEGQGLIHLADYRCWSD